MVQSVVRRSLAAAGFLLLAGCAQQGSHPAYLGLADLSGDDPTDNPSAAQSGASSEALRHVQSNKVLGAMAFQKVTGNTVDPESLVGRAQ
ncbi:hypothetical protein [Hyphomicrobium sp.]|uniref:hypothetical protein n=1 Tax=Hyphomicrobium sp. TaxID=82 RepID=UPI002D787108|nr:hypothetical protein [Hyphomicrobium sp.]HET6389936.1 hypothetical protein [Hyphomicrobium sp.]